MFPYLTIFDYQLRTMGFFIILALVAFLLVVRWYSYVCNQRVDFLRDNFLPITISTLASSYLVFWILHLSWFSWNLLVLSPLNYSYSWVGFLVGFFLILFYYHGSKNQFFKKAEVFLPAILILDIFIELGLFVSGIKYGTETNMFWGINYSEYLFSPILLLAPLHPVSIYKVIFYLGLLVLFELVLRHRYSSESAFYLLFTLLFTGEFFLDFYRGDDINFFFGLILDQWISLILIVIFTTLFYLKRKK